jgi:guanylate kinase
LIVVSGPSGAGKSTIVRSLLERREFTFSVSVTTRARRPTEDDGVDYLFVDREAFQRMVVDGDLLEWAEYGDNLYGTPRGPVEAALVRGEDVLLEIEVQGARQIRETHPSARMVFIAPPDLGELERRLRNRGDTDDDAIERRMDIARRELEDAGRLFDVIVVNDDVERATAEIKAYLDDPGSRPDRPSVYPGSDPRSGTRPGIREVQTE